MTVQLLPACHEAAALIIAPAAVCLLVPAVAHGCGAADRNVRCIAAGHGSAARNHRCLAAGRCRGCGCACAAVGHLGELRGDLANDAVDGTLLTGLPDGGIGARHRTIHLVLRIRSKPDIIGNVCYVHVLGQPGLVGIDNGGIARVLHDFTVLVGHGRQLCRCRTLGQNGVHLDIEGHRILQLVLLDLFHRQIGFCDYLIHVFRRGAKVSAHLDAGRLCALHILIEISILRQSVGDTHHHEVQPVRLGRLPVNGTVLVLELRNLCSLLQVRKVRAVGIFITAPVIIGGACATAACRAACCSIRRHLQCIAGSCGQCCRRPAAEQADRHGHRHPFPDLHIYPYLLLYALYIK